MMKKTVLASAVAMSLSFAMSAQAVSYTHLTLPTMQ